MILDEKPVRRIVLCHGQFCNMDRRAEKLYKLLEPMIAELNGDAYPPRVKLVTANCLSMCGAGPNCIIQPGGMPFNRLDDDSLKRVVDEYLRD